MSDRKCYICNCDLHEFSESKVHKGKCRHCYAQYCRDHHKKKFRKDRVSARNAARYLLKKGIIVKQNCTLCGSPHSEIHHPDYSKPTDITWLCVPCHKEFHILQNKVLKAA